MIALSLGLAVPAFIAVKAGQEFSERIDPETLERLSVLLIAAIGLKLLPF